MHSISFPKATGFCRWAVLFTAMLLPNFAIAQQPASGAVQLAQEPQFITRQGYRIMATMPELPGGGGAPAIIRAIQNHIHYPPDALRRQLEGIVEVNFTVDSTGAVKGSKIIRSVGGGCDQVVLTAVQQLPRFNPGTREGRPVAMSISIPITFQLEGSRVDLLDTLKRVYPLVDQMPQLPGGGGSTAIFRAIQRAVVMPAEVSNDTLLHKVFVGFIVGPSGVVRDVKVVRKLNSSCDAAALAAVRKLPRFVGGKLNGVPASVSFTVPVLFGRLPKE